MLELVILKVQGMAATGQPGAVREMDWLRQLLPDADPNEDVGFLIAPAEVTDEEFIAQIELRDRGKVEPGTEVDIKAEEFLKAVNGIPSPLGEAILAFHRRNSGH